MMCGQPGQLWGHGQRQGRGHSPQGRRRQVSLVLGRDLGAHCPLRAPHLATSCREIWCRVDSPEWGQGLLGGLGSVRDLRVGRQSTFTTPVGLPETPV